MSPLFGKRKEEGKTFLIVDVETGSVGVALARLSPYNLPKVFGEWRKAVPLQQTHNLDALARLVDQTVKEALVHAGQVAARVRAHPGLGRAGEVGQVAVFLSPPWGVLSITNRELPQHPFVRQVHNSIESYFGPLPTTTLPFGLVAAHTAPLVAPHDDHMLLAIVGGEVIELTALKNTGENFHIAAHATLPFGHHYPLRTLLSHGGLGEAEARSALALYAQNEAPYHAREALHTAGAHVAQEFGSAVRELLQHVPAQKVLVMAGEPAGGWFARSLAAAPELQQVFTEPAEVSIVHPRHLSPFISAHARKPDLPLLLETLFIHSYQPAEQARFIGQE